MFPVVSLDGDRLRGGVCPTGIGPATAMGLVKYCIPGHECQAGVYLRAAMAMSSMRSNQARSAAVSRGSASA